MYSLIKIFEMFLPVVVCAAHEASLVFYEVQPTHPDMPKKGMAKYKISFTYFSKNFTYNLNTKEARYVKY